MTYTLMPVVLMIMIICIALEEQLKVNKAAISMLGAITLWGMLLLGADSILGAGKSADFNEFAARVAGFTDQPAWEQYTKYITEFALLNHLGDVATTLFFVMCSMTIVELVDAHGGFRVLTDRIRTKNKRKFLWIICILTFLLSALLDNIATAIVMIAILRKFIPHQKERWIFASMVIIAANAGGSWSPIGDVTTILLWTNGNLSPAHQISSVLLPATVFLLVPLTIATRFFKKGEVWHDALPMHEENDHIPEIRNRSRHIILLLGVLSLAMVPVFNELTGLPPFMGVMVGLSILWVYTDLMYYRSSLQDSQKLPLVKVLSRMDMSTILFFFGVLMAIAAVNTAGQLQQASAFLDSTLHRPNLIAFILGACSSFLDNVALVAGAMGMYPIVEAGCTDPYLLNFMADGTFWTFLAYCCVTGGSLLIIGSATGVSVMGMEKITFGYYLKNFSLLALSGYVSGALVYLLLM